MGRQFGYALQAFEDWLEALIDEFRIDSARAGAPALTVDQQAAYDDLVAQLPVPGPC